MSVTIDHHDISVEVENIVRRIKQGYCILFLGPNVLKTQDGIPLNNAFARHLGEKLESKGFAYERSEKENMSYMIQKYIKEINDKLKTENLKMVDIRGMYIDFLKEVKIDYSLYELLSRLPFTLVINTNYDTKFFELFEGNMNTRNIKASFSFYDISNVPDPKDPIKIQIAEPGIKNPLVYNIFGVCEEDNINSLVLTEIEFIRLVGRIHQPNTNIPSEITRHINVDKNCLFVGFDFAQWHLKVVIKTLLKGDDTNFRNEKNLPLTRALGIPNDIVTTFFYNDEFKFSFITQVDFLGDIQSNYFKEPILPIAVENSIQEGPVKLVFVSDIKNRQDIFYRDQIFKQLTTYVSKGSIICWAEDLELGIESAEQMMIEKIEEADMIIAMVSVDFIISKKKDLIEKGLSSNTKSNQKKMAILLRPCLYENISFSQDYIWAFTGQTEDKKIQPLSLSDKDYQEALISDIAKSIIKLISNVRI